MANETPLERGEVPEHVAAYCAGILMGMQLIARAAARAAGVPPGSAFPSIREFHHTAALACRAHGGLGEFSDEALITAAIAWHRGHPVVAG